MPEYTCADFCESIYNAYSLNLICNIIGADPIYKYYFSLSNQINKIYII